MDQRKRRAALHFLRNISLDGHPPPQGYVQGAPHAGMGGKVVATSTWQHHSCTTTAPVHSSGGDDQTSGSDVPTPLPVTNKKVCDSEVQAAIGTKSHPHVTPCLSDTAVTGRATTPAPLRQRSLSDASGAQKKQTHNSADSQSCSTSLEHQRTRRRLAFQRLNTLQDIDENTALSSVSSPRPKSSKRVHFIRNVHQYDTSDGRIILISFRRAICFAFSLIPYQEHSHTGNITPENGYQHVSGATPAREMAICVEGVELGTHGKVVSYTQLLYPTYALMKGRTHIIQQRSAELFYPAAPRGFHPMRTISPHYSGHTGLLSTAYCSDTQDYRHSTAYDPNLLEDPHWPCGKHKRVLTTVIEYTKPSELKRDMNQTFREKFPHIRLTLSKIRSLKREIRKLAQEDCGYEVPTVAMALVYFEKLALRGKLDKQNRKLCAGACILLAAKIGSDMKRHDVKQLIDRLEERLRLNRRELLVFELTVFVALEFNLHLPDHELMPHYRRLMLTT